MTEDPNPYLSPQTSQRPGPTEQAPSGKILESLPNSVLGAVLGFAVGVLGNLVAAWIQQEWLNPFTLPLLYVILALTIVGLSASIWLSRIPSPFPKFLRIKDRFLSRGLALAIIATPITVAFSLVILKTIAGAGDCSEAKVEHVELYLGTPQPYPVDKTIEQALRA